MVFLLLALILFSIPFSRNFEDGSIVAFVVRLGPLILSIAMFRSTRQRSTKPTDRD